MDIILMLLTAWVIIKPKSDALFEIYPSIPIKDTNAFGQS